MTEYKSNLSFNQFNLMFKSNVQQVMIVFHSSSSFRQPLHIQQQEWQFYINIEAVVEDLHPVCIYASLFSDCDSKEMSGNRRSWDTAGPGQHLKHLNPQDPNISINFHKTRPCFDSQLWSACNHSYSTASTFLHYISLSKRVFSAILWVKVI